MKIDNSSANGFFNTKRRYLKLTVYAVALLTLGLVLLAKKRPEAVWELAITAAVMVYEFYHIKKSQKEFVGYIENLDFCLNDNSRGTLFNYPAPLVVTNISGEITWYNENFRKAVDKSDLFGTQIRELVPEIQISKFTNTEENTHIKLEIGENHYEVWGNVAHANSGRTNGRSDLVVLYFIDKTEEVHAIRFREDERMIECIVIIDNYDEVLKETADSNHGALLGEIEQKINAWVTLGNGILRKYERDKFIAFFSNKDFEKIMDNKFAVLDEVRAINFENKIPVTLSIGVGKSGADVAESDKFARLAIDMALGRGGDQVVIRDGDNFTFFGAKTREVEKRTKVKARVVAHALRELVDHSGKVFIMGHASSDMDSIGASIGLFKAVKSRGKDAYIIANSQNSNAKLLIDEFSQMDEYEDAFITSEQALNLFNAESLVIVVDVHRPGMVECPELLQHAKEVVLIDHHRRSEDFIENAVLVYHEPYASSTCEMITEILQYIQDGQRLTKQEAEALYAGIFMDTKGFTFKAGVRTFEAASYLRRMGVDTVSVRRLFKTDLQNYIARADIIKSATVYRENIAFSYLYEECPNMAVTVAQAADELLDISGIEASFVLAKSGNRVVISGRSLESVNVQVILEKLGGGGHITIAGAQLDDVSVEEADEMLKNAVDEVLNQ
ncbi:MAG: DHH family phosphoesterase [Clostridia bacterium]|nr:DHH family phosphoesterase [Clostridia bacterium]